MTAEGATPVMQQYREIKARHRDAILFFRMGDFYEMFYDDAQTASRTLGLTLTSRNNGGAADVPLAGVPVRAAAEYVRRLVERGFRVAICEQVEDPKVAKGVVRRAVVETVTPGVAFADDLLDGARENFLVAVCQSDQRVGFAAADVSTGVCKLVIAPNSDAPATIARLAPREILIAAGSRASLPEGLLPADVLVCERDPWEFDPALAREMIASQFAVAFLDGLGLGDDDAAAIGAAGALLRYLTEAQPVGLAQLRRPSIERPGTTMPLDDMTRRNLELVESPRGGRDATVLGALDRTVTPMGARRLRAWLLAPLLDRAAIEQRLDAVAAFATDALARTAIRAALDGVRDVERLAAKTAAQRATARELRALGDSLTQVPVAHAAFSSVAGSGLLAEVVADWDDAGDIAGDICRTFVARPPLAIGDGETIAAGVDA